MQVERYECSSNDSATELLVKCIKSKMRHLPKVYALKHILCFNALAIMSAITKVLTVKQTSHEDVIAVLGAVT